MPSRAAKFVALALLVGFAAPARADFSSINTALQFAVIGQCSNNQTNFNNGTITGDVGICSPRQFTISNASMTGNLRFSGNANTGGFSPDLDPNGGCGPFTVSGGGSFNGCIVTGDGAVTAALNQLNVFSQDFGGVAGTAVTVTNGGGIDLTAAGGCSVVHSGDCVYNGNVSSCDSNQQFNIHGTAGQYLVVNLPGGGNLHCQILLSGGITSDHVVFNVNGGDYTAHTGGASLDVNTNGLQTFGIFLDLNGTQSATHTDIRGRLFGGDQSNQQIVSGFNITAPPNTVPEPATVALLVPGLVGIAGIRRFARRRQS